MIFKVEILYRQIAVFNADLERPFNDWREEHIAQGFSWRPGSVSFATLKQDGIIRISVLEKQLFRMRADSIRAISVPFSVTSSNTIEVGSIAEYRLFNLEAGEYRLIFEHGADLEGLMWCDFTFIRATVVVHAEILRTDDLLDLSKPLLMEAEPA